MKTITRDEFSPSIVVDELLDGAGVIMLKDVFSPERIKRIAQTLEAETDEANDTGSHFNQNDQDPLLNAESGLLGLLSWTLTSQVWWKNR